jgi:hypothetical protein
MQLKIIHVINKQDSLDTNCDEFEEVNSNGKVLLVDRKVDTYSTLKQTILKEFFLDNKDVIDEELFRLRAYNV